MTDASLTSQFRQAVPKPKIKPLPPLSFRATHEERELLKRAAGTKSVSAYIREVLFADAAAPRRGSKRRPSVDDVALGQALSVWGQARLSSNLTPIAQRLNAARLPVDGDLKLELYKACADVRQMREALIAALNIKSVE